MEDKEAGNLGSFSTLDGNLHTTQILSGSQVAERLPMLKCIESTAEALKALSNGKGNHFGTTVLGPKHVHLISL